MLVRLLRALQPSRVLRGLGLDVLRLHLGVDGCLLGAPVSFFGVAKALGEPLGIAELGAGLWCGRALWSATTWHRRHCGGPQRPLPTSSSAGVAHLAWRSTTRSGDMGSGLRPNTEGYSPSSQPAIASRWPEGLKRKGRTMDKDLDQAKG